MSEAKKPSKKMLRDEIENIRLTATSPYHLITALQSFWLRHGIEVIFTNYPSTFSLEVSNSHNAPRGYPRNWCGRSKDKDIPKSYPGWSGNWEGTVNVLDSCTIAKKDTSLSDLKGTWSNSPMDVWYIQTGSGGGGNSFRYSGMLWLYDFPQMFKEFESQGGQVQLLDTAYNNILADYRKSYHEKKDAFICTHPLFIECKACITELNTVSTTLAHNLSQLTQHLERTFNTSYDVPIPEALTTFAGAQKLLKEIYVETNEMSTVVHPDLQETFNLVAAAKGRASRYISEHPEYLF